MRMLSVLIAAVVPSVAMAAADEPACSDISARLVQSTGASFEKFSTFGTTAWFKSDRADWITVECENNEPFLMVGSSSPYPSIEFFELSAEVGDLVADAHIEGVSSKLIECHRAALNRSQRKYRTVFGKLRLSCAVDMKLGTMITVQKK